MAKVLAEIDTEHCDVIHDSQLDGLGKCLATASADGTVRLFDVTDPSQPSFLTQLSGHEKSVNQIAWAHPLAGAMLASASDDGTVVVWGRSSDSASRWEVLRREDIKSHGAVRSLAWSPVEHGAVLACASEDGTVSLLVHAPQSPSGFSGEVPGVPGHRWEPQRFQTNQGDLCAVSWASAPAMEASEQPSLMGARLVAAGSKGVGVWRRTGDHGSWEPEAMDPKPAPDAAAQDAGSASTAVRDVAWRYWDGIEEVIASVVGKAVDFWAVDKETGKWRIQQRVTLDDDAWKASWTDVGNMLVVSYGASEQRTALLKQRLDGVWDVMEIAAQEE